jgi:hypothetical protein
MPQIASGFDSDCPSSQLNQPFASPNPIAVGTSPVKLMDANSLRRELIIVNTGTTILAIDFVPNPNYTTGQFRILLPPCSSSRDGTGGVFVSDMWQGQVWIVSSASSGECVITEMI